MNAVPEEGRLDNAHFGRVPAELLCHGHDGNAHVDSVHVTEHECYKTEPDDRPPPLPALGVCCSLL